MRERNGYVGIILLLFFSLVTFAVLSTKIPQFELPEDELLPEISIGGCIPYTGTNPPTIEAFAPGFGQKVKNQGSDEEEADVTGAIDAIAQDAKTKKALRKASIDVTKKARYRLILSNVAILTNYLNDNLVKGIDADGKGIDLYFGSSAVREINGTRYYLLYPKRHGQLHTGKAGPLFKGINKLKLGEYGLVFLTPIQEDGRPKIIERKAAKEIDLKGSFIVTDVYQEETLVHTKPLPSELIKLCQGVSGDGQPTELEATTTPEPPKIVYPEQDKSKDQKQLQLQYFLFEENIGQGIVRGGWSVHCKPAIYLYPTEKTKVNVRVNTSGFLTYVDPPYPKTGWDVLAYPDGTLETNQKRYEYLYYESAIPDDLIEKPKEGYVVLYSELPSLYKMLLPRLGLSKKQTDDFTSYWETTLPKAPYYLVGLLSKDNIDTIDPLTIIPKPETIVRVRLYFEALDKKIEVPTPSIVTPEKRGFTIVEWGGMVKRDKNHPFTCSQ